MWDAPSWSLCFFLTSPSNIFPPFPHGWKAHSVTPCIHIRTDTYRAQPSYVTPPNHIFNVFHDGCRISAHLLNKWNHKKESWGGCLFWGAFTALPPSHCLRAVICREIEMRLAAGAGLALDLHTLLNHTDSRLLALPTTPPRSQIYLHAGAPPESEPYGSDNTVRHRFPIPACCWQWWMLSSDCQRIIPSPGLLWRTWRRTSDQEGQPVKERRQRFRWTCLSGGHCLWWDG